MIDGHDFAGWVAAERAGVLDEGAWRRMSRICATVGQSQGAKVNEEQFMPRPQAPPEQSEAKMMAMISSVFGPPQPAKKEG